MYQAAGAAAQIIGQVMQAVAANKAKHAMEQAFKNELRRQRGYRNEAFGVVEQAFPRLGVETAREQMGAGQNYRLGAYGDAGQQSFSAEQPTGMGASALDKASVDMSGQARAKLGSYTDWQLDQMIEKIRTQDELNRINNFASGEASIFPYLMSDAQHSADGLAFGGSLLSSLGGAASGMGMMGGFSMPKKPVSFGGGGTSLYDLPSGFGSGIAGYA